MARNVWVDKETMKMEEILIERNKDFNFSNLYKEAVIRAANQEKELDLEKKKKKLLEIKKQIGYLTSDFEILEEEIKSIEEKQQRELQQMKIDEEEEEKELIKRRIGPYMKYFSLVESDAIDFSNEYQDALNNGYTTSWIEFGKSKGLTFNKELWEKDYGIQKNKK